MALHQLENEHLCVTIDDHGAELCSVFDKEAGCERIWNADPKVWNRHAPILFPFVGRVIQGKYRHLGREYEMKTQHGFARDMDFRFVEQTADSITHSLKDTEATRIIYPFSFELLVTHRLTGANGRTLEVEWEVVNRGDEEMLYSIGGHPGFTTPASETEKRSQYYLEFPGKKTLEYILVNPATGFAVPETAYQLKLENGYLQIADNLFDKDALIFEKGQVSVVRIARPDKTPYVTMECPGFCSLGVWSKPEGRFVCLEPWLGRVDDDGFRGELREKPGEQSLPAGGRKHYSYRIEFHA